MDYQLTIVRGRSASATIKLVDGVTTVGRHDDCHLRIKSSQVSRKHCELFEKKGLLLVKDLGSSNGTYVNGKRVEGQRVLEPGDELTVGQVTLKIAKAGSVPEAGPKPGDTAVVQATSAKPADDDFDIEFDDAIELDTEEPTPAAVTPAAAAPPATPAARPAEPAAAKTPEPAPTTQVDKDADDAVADFLLDLKFDDD